MKRKWAFALVVVPSDYTGFHKFLFKKNSNNNKIPSLDNSSALVDSEKSWKKVFCLTG